MAIEMRRRTWTVEEYHRMVELGLLSEGDRIELIEGEIVEMAPMGVPHNACCTWLHTYLTPRLLGRATIQVAGPVTISDRSEPEPDLAVLRWRDRLRAKATPADVHLLIEVSDSSLRFDRLVKAPMYSRSGIPELWVVDLPGDTLEVHDQPGPDGYGRVRTFGRGDAVALPGFEDVVVDIGDLLG